MAGACIARPHQVSLDRGINKEEGWVLLGATELNAADIRLEELVAAKALLENLLRDTSQNAADKAVFY